MMPKVLVMTDDEYIWCLRPFTFVFNHYWGEDQQVVVGGYNYPPFPLPRNFTFHSIATKKWPIKMWSDGMIKLFDELPDSHYVFMLVDYWLTRPVNVCAVEAAYEYMKNLRVIRFDLTTPIGVHDIDTYGCYDITESPHRTGFRFNEQVGIWNIKLVNTILRPGLDPWGLEFYMTDNMKEEDRVLGMRQHPVRYVNVLSHGKINDEQISQVPTPILQSIIDQGMIPKGFPHYPG